MITLIGVLKTISFLSGVVLMINLFKKNSEYNKESDNVNY